MPHASTSASTIVSQIHPESEPPGTGAGGTGWMSVSRSTSECFPADVSLVFQGCKDSLKPVRPVPR